MKDTIINKSLALLSIVLWFGLIMLGLEIYSYFDSPLSMQIKGFLSDIADFLNWLFH